MNTTTRENSSTPPTRPSGISAAAISRTEGTSDGVSIAPGVYVTTRILSGASSLAPSRVIPRTPHLDTP